MSIQHPEHTEVVPADSVKEFRLDVRVRNNRLIRLREELRLSQAGFAKEAGVSVSTYNALETFRSSPLQASGDWTDTATKIAEFHGVSSEWIWPKLVKERKRLAAASVEVSAADMTSLLEERSRAVVARRLLMSLTPREMKVVAMRLGIGTDNDHTLEEVGNAIGTQRERVRQIEQKALHKLRTQVVRKSMRFRNL